MIILNLNPCYDNWVILDRPSLTENVEHGDRVLEFVDGKGLNIGRVLKLFQFDDFTTLNIIGGLTGDLIEQECRREGIPFEAFRIEGRSRINTAVVYAWKNDMKMINQSGPEIRPAEIELFLNTFTDWVTDSPSDIVLSGSAPRAFSPEHLTQLVDIALAEGCRIKVDIGPKWLKAIGTRGLDLIKVNDEEFRQTFGFDPREKASTCAFMEKTKTGLLVVTYGKNGAIACDGSRFLEATFAQTESNLAVGSGDSFLAGFLLGQVRNLKLETCLEMASACGYANTLQYGPGFFTIEQYERALAQVRIGEL